jgi:hypothetical protein
MLDQMLERDKRKGIPPAKTQERFDRWFEDEYLIPRTDIKR